MIAAAPVEEPGDLNKEDLNRPFVLRTDLGVVVFRADLREDDGEEWSQDRREGGMVEIKGREEEGSNMRTPEEK